MLPRRFKLIPSATGIMLVKILVSSPMCGDALRDTTKYFVHTRRASGGGAGSGRLESLLSHRGLSDTVRDGAGASVLRMPGSYWTWWDFHHAAKLEPNRLQTIPLVNQAGPAHMRPHMRHTGPTGPASKIERGGREVKKKKKQKENTNTKEETEETNERRRKKEERRIIKQGDEGECA